MPKSKRFFWLLSLAVLLLVCGASPLFFAPFYGAGLPAPCAESAPLGQLLRVDLNTATLEQLCTLPGIGEKRAGAILAYRQEHGGFDSLEAVCMVDGISQKTVQKWGGLAYVSQPAPPGAP